MCLGTNIRNCISLNIAANVLRAGDSVLQVLFALVLLFLFWEETRRNLIILRTPRPLSAVPAMPRLERKERAAVRPDYCRD